VIEVNQQRSTILRKNEEFATNCCYTAQDCEFVQV